MLREKEYQASGARRSILDGAAGVVAAGAGRGGTRRRSAHQELVPNGTYRGAGEPAHRCRRGQHPTDIAFWGDLAFQGSWLGFNIRDISAPGNPKPVSFTSCTGNQGDLVVRGDVLVRSWNSPAALGATCDGETVPEGFEGLHIFDISDVRSPYSYPPPIPPPGRPFCGGLGCEIGGAWSSYWYNNFIYETHINEGLNVFRFSGEETAGALRLDHLNPQTQMFTLP